MPIVKTITITITITITMTMTITITLTMTITITIITASIALLGTVIITMRQKDYATLVVTDFNHISHKYTNIHFYNNNTISKQ